MMDHYGRVWTIKIATVNILITGFATPFVNGFFMFSVLRFLMGLSHPTFFICTFMLSKLYLSTCHIMKVKLMSLSLFSQTALEYVSNKKRSLVGNLSLAIGLPIGGCLQAWILEAVGDWIIFHHILFSQTIFYLISIW